MPRCLHLLQIGVHCFTTDMGFPDAPIRNLPEPSADT